MKAKHQRLWFIALSIVMLCGAALFALQAFKQNIVYFFSPTDLETAQLVPMQTMRLGGLVRTGSLVQADEDYTFDVTDGNAQIRVYYSGLVPNLFREGQGVIVEGHMDDDGTFIATRILAKHDENYMPPEVIDSLKKTGRWRGEAQQAR